MSDDQYPEIEYVVREQPPQRRSLLRRAGCGLLLAIWFLVLLLPLAFFILAIEGDITIARGSDIPDRHEHPRLQVRLISEADFRGLGFTTTSLDRDGDNALCIETRVRFLLWEGDGEPATFCDCYSRVDVEADWQLDVTTSGECEG